MHPTGKPQRKVISRAKLCDFEDETIRSHNQHNKRKLRKSLKALFKTELSQHKFAEEEYCGCIVRVFFCTPDTAMKHRVWEITRIFTIKPALESPSTSTTCPQDTMLHC
ncbi:hypothetical protein RvY_17867 [Ramazzottius varieornatus]|uniref:Uncharacterized protein n=1 Tax=Ramazzottius varieornatus TaxID=947166 RepID=A0A1D1W7B6_RAMVA|nr:hypothetical protein RvY_17867 [Ramazzottius varieornatus]